MSREVKLFVLLAALAIQACVHTSQSQETAALVGFLANNPDEPIIVGQIPNALTPPPYPLPEHATNTVIRTQSTPDGEGFNEE